MCAHRLETMGAIARWSRVRGRWFVRDASGGLVLLALWPVALLFPAAVPFGLGQVAERIESTLVELLEDTPFLEWLPIREVELQPLLAGTEFVCVVLGLLIPSLLGFCILRRAVQRVVFALLTIGAGAAATGLSAALSYAPQHAWDWMPLPVAAAMATALLAALALVATGQRLCAALGLLALGVYLGLLNQAPADPYFSQTLQTWEQGRFIRFNGLAQWVGWLWPYGAVLYLLARLQESQPKN
jgi:hypothetical protein